MVGTSLLSFQKTIQWCVEGWGLRVPKHPPKAKKCRYNAKPVFLVSDHSKLLFGAPCFIIVSYDMNLLKSLRRALFSAHQGMICDVILMGVVD